MPCCCALHCNRRTPDFRAFRFPANPERRRIWVENMGREEWQPKPSSRLCEFHFDEDQFEKNRQDGFKKLKCIAVPTIFTHNEEVVSQWVVKLNLQTAQDDELRSDTELSSKKPASRVGSVQNKGANGENNRTLSKLTNGVTEEMETTENTSEALSENQFNSISGNAPNHQTIPDISFKLDIKSIKLIHKDNKNYALVPIEQFTQMTNQLEQLSSGRVKLVSEIERLRDKLRIALNRMHYLAQNLGRFFNEDQFEVLKRKSASGMKWSKETIEKAKRIRKTCGERGYKLLQALNCPLPSFRTLQREIKPSKRKEPFIRDNGNKNVLDDEHNSVNLLPSDLTMCEILIPDQPSRGASETEEIIPSSAEPIFKDGGVMCKTLVKAERTTAHLSTKSDNVFPIKGSLKAVTFHVGMQSSENQLEPSAAFTKVDDRTYITSDDIQNDSDGASGEFILSI